MLSRAAAEWIMAGRNALKEGSQRCFKSSENFPKVHRTLSEQAQPERNHLEQALVLTNTTTLAAHHDLGIRGYKFSSHCSAFRSCNIAVASEPTFPAYRSLRSFAIARRLTRYVFLRLKVLVRRLSSGMTSVSFRLPCADISTRRLSHGSDAVGRHTSQLHRHPRCNTRPPISTIRGRFLLASIRSCSHLSIVSYSPAPYATSISAATHNGTKLERQALPWAAPLHR